MDKVAPRARRDGICEPAWSQSQGGWLSSPFVMRYVCPNASTLQHIFESVKKSLERLQLDYIDVLQCHRFDAETPIEETMQALHDVVKAGYVRYIGMSSCYAWQCAYSFKDKLSDLLLILAAVHIMQSKQADARALTSIVNGQ